MYRPLISLKTKALLYYLQSYLRPPKDVLDLSAGIGDFFLPVWRSRADCPILDLAVSSMSMALFARTQQDLSAGVEASVNYQDLLRIAQRTTPSRRQGNLEACMLATFCMSRYESVVYKSDNINAKSQVTRNLNSFSHDDGSRAILKIWKDESEPNQPVSDVVKNVRRGIIRSLILRNMAVPDWMKRGDQFGERGIELEYDRLLVRVVNLRHRVAQIADGQEIASHELSDPRSLLKTLELDALEIDEALKSWTKVLPKAWRYTQRRLTEPYPWPVRDFFSSTVYTFLSPNHAGIWVLYFMLRMLINSALVKIFDVQNPPHQLSSERQRSTYVVRLEHLADDLACSIPFALQRVKVADDFNSTGKATVSVDTWREIKPSLATLVAFPLSVASRLGNLDMRYKSWFASELARVGRAVGIGLLEAAEHNAWPMI